jgi:hypothetical protein
MWAGADWGRERRVAAMQALGRSYTGIAAKGIAALRCWIPFASRERLLVTDYCLLGGPPLSSPAGGR